MKKILISLFIILKCCTPAMAQDKKISQLPALPSVSGNEQLPLAKSGANYYTTPNQIKSWLTPFLFDSTKFIPRAGTYTAYPQTGTIEFDNSSSLNTTAIWQNSATGNGFWVGFGDNKNLSTASKKSIVAFFDDEFDAFVSDVSGNQGYLLTSSYDNQIGLTYNNGSKQSVLQFQNTGIINIHSNDVLFKGLKYDAATEGYVSTNQDGFSILDRNINDARYLSSTYSTAVTSASNPLSITTNTISLKYASPFTLTSGSLTIGTASVTNSMLANSTWTANGVPMSLGSSSTTIGAGTGISITSGSVITNTAPDQTVTLTGAGSATVTGTYPTFTVNSSGASYTGGAGITINSTTITAIPRTTTVTSSATVTINASTTDLEIVSSQSTACTFSVSNTGAIVDGQPLTIRYKDNGSSQTLTFSNNFNFSAGLPAPTSTPLGKYVYIYCTYNTGNSKYDVTAISSGY